MSIPLRGWGVGGAKKDADNFSRSNVIICRHLHCTNVIQCTLPVYYLGL